MKLRNEFEDLDELVTVLEVDRETLERRLAERGFVYDPAQNQFRHATE